MTPSKSDATDTTIVEGYLAGDAAANRYVEECIELTYRTWQNRFGYQKADIFSDVRYKLLISLRKKKFAYRSSLKSFIGGIVRHTCLDYLRAIKRWDKVDIEEHPQVDTAPTAEEALQKKQRAMLYFRVLRLVPRECLKLWRLRLKKGLTCGEIGDRLGMSDVNVRGRLMNCRRKATKIREELLNDGQRFDS